jgi:hypothetical protein
MSGMDSPRSHFPTACELIDTCWARSACERFTFFLAEAILLPIEFEFSIILFLF